MTYNNFIITKSRWLSNFLDRVEILLWGNSVEVDTSTPTFYVFKPYPSSLKSAQYDDWGILQRKILSPYKNGEHHMFISRDGICFWAVPDKLKGLPETAIQQSLEDGTHYVKGKTQLYEQCWQNNVMVRCRSLPISYEIPGPHERLEVSKNSTGWAVERNIDIWLAKPITWFCTLIFLFLSIFVWQLGSLSSHVIQAYYLQEEASELEVQVGDKLAIQTKIQHHQSVIELLSKWQHQNGFLPQALADVASVVVKYDTWEAANIEWQGKRLVLLITLNNTDIPTLVSDLEKTNLFSDVAIRPHSQVDTWTLEVVQR